MRFEWSIILSLVSILGCKSMNEGKAPTGPPRATEVALSSPLQFIYFEVPRPFHEPRRLAALNERVGAELTAVGHELVEGDERSEILQSARDPIYAWGDGQLLLHVQTPRLVLDVALRAQSLPAPTGGAGKAALRDIQAHVQRPRVVVTEDLPEARELVAAAVAGPTDRDPLGRMNELVRALREHQLQAEVLEVQDFVPAPGRLILARARAEREGGLDVAQVQGALQRAMDAVAPGWAVLARGIFVSLVAMNYGASVKRELFLQAAPDARLGWALLPRRAAYAYGELAALEFQSLATEEAVWAPWNGQDGATGQHEGGFRILPSLIERIPEDQVAIFACSPSSARSRPQLFYGFDPTRLGAPGKILPGQTWYPDGPPRAEAAPATSQAPRNEPAAPVAQGGALRME